MSEIEKLNHSIKVGRILNQLNIKVYQCFRILNREATFIENVDLYYLMVDIIKSSILIKFELRLIFIRKRRESKYIDYKDLKHTILFTKKEKLIIKLNYLFVRLSQVDSEYITPHSIFDFYEKKPFIRYINTCIEYENLGYGILLRHL